jgi:hypothetical protein
MRTRLDLFVLAAFGTYRVWRFVARDTITKRWRETAYNRWPPTYARSLAVTEWSTSMHQSVVRGRPEHAPTPRVSWVAAHVDCAWCGGASLSALATAVVNVTYGVVAPVLWWLALSTAVGLLSRADG